MQPRSTLPKLALLLFGSGFCALVYQVAWLRLLRLIFGSSTPATAAVLAIFMAGLGFGSLVLGPRADRDRNPLALYGRLELGISVAAALSPLLIVLARQLYFAAGGSLGLGPGLGAVLRLLLAAIVLGVPTFLMGGTLPAMSRAAERSSDQGRRLLGLLYGVNTLGAVAGALTTTFFSIEVLGIRQTIWVAALINLLVALFARKWASEPGEAADVAADETVFETAVEEGGSTPPQAPFLFVMLAAGVVGFAFFLMELVWYRMLSPLLGGSSYTFGLILAIALLGIGAGGLLYGAGSRQRRPTLGAFAATCALEALFIVLPFAAGDRLALLARLLRDLSTLGFSGLVVSWLVVTVLVVLPAAVVAGYQFPLLVALLGSGSRGVGREVGLTYASNTLGAIGGSLAGGFGLIPLLTAPGVWRLVTVVLILLALLATLLEVRGTRLKPSLALPVSVAMLALLLCASRGPTAFWRHSPIGAGRVQFSFSDPNQLRSAIHQKSRAVRWEADGLESSVALQAVDGISLMVNGKSDGHARTDAPTQVMSGLVSAALHPEPRTALVIGLGTGSTAGWLAEVPSMERVDVVELEPAVLPVAEACAPVSQDALSHPKVQLLIGDGREVLMTTRERYDVIFSEPSNPYRAGIASLFTRDFYGAVADRLTERGIFVQWLQGYEIDGQAVRTTLATLGSVFPSVESWEVHRADLLLVAGGQAPDHDLQRLAKVLEGEPYRSAMNKVWGVEGLEGFYSAFVADNSFTNRVREAEGDWINTDDRPIMEFRFARNVGRKGLFRIDDLRRLVERRGEDRPELIGDEGLDWELLRELRAARSVAIFRPPAVPAGLDPSEAARYRARVHYARGNLMPACTSWLSQVEEPLAPIDVLLLAECLAQRGDDRAPEFAERLVALERPIEALATLARWHAHHGRWREAGASAAKAFEGYREDPWSHPPVMERLSELAKEIAGHDREVGHHILASVAKPFSVFLMEEKRLQLVFDLARMLDFDRLCGPALEQFEPNVPWDRTFLIERVRCYRQLDDPRQASAASDLARFMGAAPFPLDAGLVE